MSDKVFTGSIGSPGIDPNSFYRRSLVVKRRYLGYGSSQLAEKIKAGEIEPPIKLSESGRASGWFGRYLIERQAELEARAAAPRPRRTKHP